DGIRDRNVTGVQTCALPILRFFVSYPPTGMKQRILESVLNEENGADTNSEVEKQQDKEDDNHLTAAQSYKSGMGDSSETHQYKKIGRASCRERVKKREEQRQ